MNENESNLPARKNPKRQLWDLWSRHLEGGQLLNGDQQLLRDALRDDLDFRQIALDEQWVDRLLLLESEKEADTESFLSQVIERCKETETKPTPPPRVVTGYTMTKRQPVVSRRKSYRMLTTWGSLAAILLLSITSIALWYRTEQQSSGTDLSESMVVDSSDKKQEAAPMSPTRALAILSSVDGATNNPWKPGDEFGAETLEVDTGEIQLTMASGVLVDVFGPSRLKLLSENSLELLAGEISASVPSVGFGFQVHTPSVVVTDLGTVFDVGVDSTGTTEVEVRNGRVLVDSRTHPSLQQWQLDAESTYQLTFYAPKSIDSNESFERIPDTIIEQEKYPVASIARSHAGDTQGVISLDGQSLKFDDEQVFAVVRDRVVRGTQESEEQTLGDWHQFVDTLTNRTVPTGTIEWNGTSFAFGNMNEIVRSQQKLFDEFSRQANNAGQNGFEEAFRAGSFQNFQGTLFIDGKRRTFNSPEEYREAMKEMLGPIANFGLLPFD